MNREYREVLLSIRGVMEGEDDLIANLANIAAILKGLPGFFWVGFYLVKNDELVLGPFQGPVACTRIGFNKGVCGTAWAEKRSILVPDVHEFPGHIACNPNSKSELVVPVVNEEGKVSMVLDIDSDELNSFDQNDLLAMEELAGYLSNIKIYAP
jgi:GAF domain-containing protein